MKIKLLVPRVGLMGAQNRGDEIDVSEAEAIRMMEAGQAVPVREEPPVERAVRGPKRGGGIIKG